MAGIFKKRSSATAAAQGYSWLGTDLHSHLIPGIDDGAADLQTSLSLIQGLQALGFHRIVTTPHIMQDYYPNTRAIIMEGLSRLQEYLAAQGVHIQLGAAAEYLVDEHFETLLEAGDLLTIPGKRVLIEFSFIAPPMKLNEILFQLNIKGYAPLLAHPERYNYFHNRFDEYRRLKDAGCSFQLNINSLYGYYGKSVKKTAWKLLKGDYIDYLGTDLHHAAHLEYLSRGLSTREGKEIMQYPFKNSQL